MQLTDEQKSFLRDLREVLIKHNVSSLDGWPHQSARFVLGEDETWLFVDHSDFGDKVFGGLCVRLQSEPVWIDRFGQQHTGQPETEDEQE